MQMTSLLPLPEKLQMKDEKNLLIQGLPSSIEKQFAKYSFSKNVTPLLKTKKIDFALVFAISQKQLTDILRDVIPALHNESKLWIAYPKVSSKIVSDLSRDCSWDFILNYGYEAVSMIALDNTWSGIRFKLPEGIERRQVSFSSQNPAGGVDYISRTVDTPAELKSLFVKHKKAATQYESLSFTNKREYAEWIVGAKKEETRARRLEKTIEMLVAGKKNPSEK